MDRTCLERKWTFERNYRRKNRRKVHSRKKANNDVRGHERKERALCRDERKLGHVIGIIGGLTVSA